MAIINNHGNNTFGFCIVGIDFDVDLWVNGGAVGVAREGDGVEASFGHGEAEVFLKDVISLFDPYFYIYSFYKERSTADPTLIMRAIWAMAIQVGGHWVVRMDWGEQMIKCSEAREIYNLEFRNR